MRKGPLPGWTPKATSGTHDGVHWLGSSQTHPYRDGDGHHAGPTARKAGAPAVGKHCARDVDTAPSRGPDRGTPHRRRDGGNEGLARRRARSCGGARAPKMRSRTYSDQERRPTLRRAGGYPPHHTPPAGKTRRRGRGATGQPLPKSCVSRRAQFFFPKLKMFLSASMASLLMTGSS